MMEKLPREISRGRAQENDDGCGLDLMCDNCILLEIGHS